MRPRIVASLAISCGAVINAALVASGEARSALAGLVLFTIAVTLTAATAGMARSAARARHRAYAVGGPCDGLTWQLSGPAPTLLQLADPTGRGTARYRLDDTADGHATRYLYTG